MPIAVLTALTCFATMLSGDAGRIRCANGWLESSLFGGEEMCYWSEGVGPWTAIGGALMLLFTAGVVLLGVWFFSRSAKSGNGALAAVRERYARGEITKEEFDRIKKDLL